MKKARQKIKDGLKFCKQCNQWKSLDEFYERIKGSGYKSGYCKPCHNVTFKSSQLCCPHCAKKLVLLGVGLDGQVVRRKSKIMQKIKEALTKPRKPRQPKTKTETTTELTVKDLFNE